MYSVQPVIYCIKYFWRSHDLHKYAHRSYPVLRKYSASQQTVSTDSLQDNFQDRKMLGINTAICAPSIWPDLCISSRGCSLTCRRASLASFRDCDPDVASFCGKRWFAAQGLHRDVFLAHSAKVMLTRNLWSEVGLVNGISRDVVDNVWAHGEKAPALLDFVVLRLEGYTGPVGSSDSRSHRCVPIAPFETSWSTTGNGRGHETRHQVPTGPVLTDNNAHEPRPDGGQGRRRPGKIRVYSGIDLRVSQLR